MPKPPTLPALIALALTGLMAGCHGLPRHSQAAQRANHLIEQARLDLAPDRHRAVFTLGASNEGPRLVLTGEVQNAAMKLATLRRLNDAGIRVRDAAEVLPGPGLGQKTWGIAAWSVCNGRENPEHMAELGTQILMGDTIRVLKQTTYKTIHWVYVQSRDGYPSWVSEGGIVRCTADEARQWSQGLLVVTALETMVLSRPEEGAEIVSDAVLLDKFKRIGEQGKWAQVRLPDGREGFVHGADVQDYQSWRQSAVATSENIEKTARRFLGRPYLWGGCSPRGLDCSGFTRLVFGLNGVDLLRNASHQATQGTPVSLENNGANLRKGDLIFFGQKAEGAKPEKITHVGICLGDQQFIHCAETVHVSSLDPASPMKDSFHLDRVLRARRILPQLTSPLTSSQ